MKDKKEYMSSYQKRLQRDNLNNQYFTALKRDLDNLRKNEGNHEFMVGLLQSMRSDLLNHLDALYEIKINK